MHPSIFPLEVRLIQPLQAKLLPHHSTTLPPTTISSEGILITLIRRFNFMIRKPILQQVVLPTTVTTSNELLE